MNKLKRGTFVTEFSDYLEKLSCLRGNLIIVGDFNINWLDTSDSERRNLFNILETFGLIQRIELPTYQNGNLLDYIITRQSNDITTDFMVSDKISDNMALHASLSCVLCCLPTPMTLASRGSPMFPLVVHQPASPSIWPAVQSLRRGLSTNPGATMWCVCGCS